MPESWKLCPSKTSQEKGYIYSRIVRLDAGAQNRLELADTGGEIPCFGSPTDWLHGTAKLCNSVTPVLLACPLFPVYWSLNNRDIFLPLLPQNNPSPLPQSEVRSHSQGTTALILLCYSDSHSWTKWWFLLKTSSYFTASAGSPKCPNSGPAASPPECSKNLCNLLGFYLWLVG